MRKFASAKYNMKKLLHTALILIALLSVFEAKATHILGGELYYTHLGGDQYEVVLMLFRDCENSTTPFDDSLDIAIYDADSDTLVALPKFYLLQDTLLPGESNDPCVVPPPGLCVRRGLYTEIITLQSRPRGYYMTYQRCCWANNVYNIQVPEDRGLTLTVQMPGSDISPVPNSSPRFTNEPPLVYCSNKEVFFDYSATDPDGDSLVYRTCTPVDFNPAGFNFNPSPEDPVPYNPTPWVLGFNAQTQLGIGATYDIDSASGELWMIPQIEEVMLTGICVDEYRNDSLISTNQRTFNVNVVGCDIIIPFSIAQSEPDGKFDDPEAIAEDCGERKVYLDRLEDGDTLIVEVKLTGTATNGVDYTFIEDTIAMPPGVTKDTITFYAFYDTIPEPTENIRAVFRYFDICEGEYDSLVTNIIIYNYDTMTVSLPYDSVNICPDEGEFVTLEPDFEGGLPPYFYEWSTDEGPQPNVLDLPINPGDIQDFVSAYSVYISDVCNKDIYSDTSIIYNQCQLIVPNVVTVNGDGINDFFIIRNIEDVPRLELIIFNRWGQEMFRSDDYKNDWNMLDQNGAPLAEGTYFYTAKVIGEKKYTYDVKERTKYQAQGFFHVVK